MARNLGRWLGFLIAISIGLLPAAVQPLIAAADSGGTLFAISQFPDGVQNELVRIDPISGAETELTDLRVSGADAQTFNLVSDPISHRLFAVRDAVTFIPPDQISFDERLLTISSQTGAILASPATGPNGLTNLVFDPSTATLYGWNRQNSVVRVKPTTGAQSVLAVIGNPNFGVVSMAIAPALHTIFVSIDDEDFETGGFSTQIVAVDTFTGAVSRSPVLDRSVRSIAYDGGLFGLSDCCPYSLIGIDPASGATAQVVDLGGPDSTQPYWSAVDPGTHSIFLDLTTQDPSGAGTFVDSLVTINDQSGLKTFSPALASGANSLAFEPVVVVTAAGLRSDVVQARASGAIDNSGVASTLLSDLDGAAKAMAKGNCKTANNLYQQFISDLTAQSGKHVAQTTANLLADEALAVMVSCP